MEQRTQSIKFAVSSLEKEQINKEALERKLTVSQFVRAAISNFIGLDKRIFELNWRKASSVLSKTALIVYLFIQEEGIGALSPTRIEKEGFMTKGAASRAIKELREKGFLDEQNNIIYSNEDPCIKRQFHQKQTYSVYKLSFPNSKIYIGITNRAPEARWDNGDGYIYNNEMYLAIEKYGWEKIIKEIMATELSWEEADQLETELIIKFSKTHDLYNKKKKPNEK